VPCVLATHWSDGGRGAEALARAVIAACESHEADPRTIYDDDETLWHKIGSVARKVYRASEVTADTRVRQQLFDWQVQGYGHFPVCIAKTQYSFSTDAKLRNAPTGHVFNVREVRLAAGAEFIVAICGDIMTMPGLPKVPAAENIDVDASGRISGLF
jgi:formate--tetrahydrofolate ligase